MATGGVRWDDSASMVAARVRLTAARLAAPSDQERPERGSGALDVLSLGGELLLRPSRLVLAPYLVGGAGVEHRRLDGPVSRAATALFVRGGLGLLLRTRTLELFIEGAPTLAASSLGSGDDVWATTYLPLILGVSIPLGRKL